VELNDLFSNKPKNEKSDNLQKKDICVIDSFLISPLIRGLGRHFNIIEDKPDNCVKRLVEGQIDCAIISSIDYAAGKGSWKIIPELCIASRGANKNINLFFNTDIRELNTIALDPGYNTSNVLLKIIMQEKYEVTPEYIEIKGSLQDKLKHADAALLTGIQAFHEQEDNQYCLDLGEEWFDLTGLPFVYALWTVNDLSFSKEEAKNIIEAASVMDQNIINSAKEISKETSFDWDLYHEYFDKRIYFKMGLEEQEALMEFYRYAFYHGFIEHIPDLHFLKNLN
jgi:chorismate dehydratase